MDSKIFSYTQNNTHSKSFGYFRLWKQPQMLLQSSLKEIQIKIDKKKYQIGFDKNKKKSKTTFKSECTKSLTSTCMSKTYDIFLNYFQCKIEKNKTKSQALKSFHKTRPTLSL